ncbi:hypothetical protein WUBG_00761 [Wuchereria bancrofti]|uniref:Uncharacterized protein n=1 Tax=Wuchereria bancrofti TaxID=6293 RepID=J9F0D4_WUCBA|nr:hypothetical protein WUBG_00761 [Wuchereria bancrofti]
MTHAYGRGILDFVFSGGHWGFGSFFGSVLVQPWVLIGKVGVEIGQILDLAF